MTTIYSVTAIKSILREKKYTNNRYRLIDTSGTNFYGYSFDLVEQQKTYDKEVGWFWETKRVVASSFLEWRPSKKNKAGQNGADVVVFSCKDIVELF